MKRWIVMVGLWMCLGGMPQAEAGVTEWPVIGQLAKVGLCILEDSGKLGEIVVRHVTEAGTEVLTTVRDCVTFVLDTVTPGTLTEEASHGEVPTS